MECEFCKSILKTANILKYHQTNSKKCLEIQANCNTKIKSSLLKCNFCKKDFSSLNTKISLEYACALILLKIFL